MFSYNGKYTDSGVSPLLPALTALLPQLKGSPPDLSSSLGGLVPDAMVLQTPDARPSFFLDPQLYLFFSLSQADAVLSGA